MAKSFTPLFIRRYQILIVFCLLIITTLLTCLDASSWRTIETNDTKIIAHYYSPFQHDSSRSTFNNEHRKFKLNVGPLWICLTTKINGKQMVITRECTINNDSFDYTIISIGVGTFILFTLFSILIIGGCLTYKITIIRLIMSFILELSTLWLIYGFFHVQKVLGPLYGWASIGFFIGIISVIIICVLEWDDYFRDVCKTKCDTTDIGKAQRLNAWISSTIHSELYQIQ